MLVGLKVMIKEFKECILILHLIVTTILGYFHSFVIKKRIKYNNIYNILNMYQAIDYMEVGYLNFPRFFFLFLFLKEGEGGVHHKV